MSLQYLYKNTSIYTYVPIWLLTSTYSLHLKSTYEKRKDKRLHLIREYEQEGIQYIEKRWLSLKEKKSTYVYLICVYVNIDRIEQAYEHMRNIRVHGIIGVKRNTSYKRSSKTSK